MKVRFSNKLVFRGAYPTKKKAKIIKEEGDFILKDGSYRQIKMGKQELHCILIEKELTRGIILYFHSNASYLGPELKGKLEKLSSITNMTVATVEYPGFGVNQTPLTHDAFFKTCESFVDYFQTGPYENIPLVFYGHSLGCLFATYFAPHYPSVHGIILQCPVPSISRIFHSLCFPKSVVEQWKRFDCERCMPAVTCPKLIIYGSRDQYNTKRQFQTIQSWITSNDIELRLEGFYHNNVPYGNVDSTWVPNIPFICCGHRFPPTESAEEQYVRSIHEFVEMNGITDFSVMNVSSLPKNEDAQSIPTVSMESIEDDQHKEDTIIVTSVLDIAASKEG